MAATRDALTKRLQSVRETTSLLYNRIMENMGYRQQKLLGDIVEKEADIDSYFDRAKPRIGTLIEKKIKEMGSAKIIMTLWVIWKKPIMSLFELDPEDAKNALDLDDGITSDNYIRLEMPFNSIMTQLFQGSDNNDLTERMLAYIKA